MLNKNKFERILEPCYIGPLRLKNRMIKTAADMGYTDQSGRIDKKTMAFYEALARGGVGLIIVDTPSIEDPGIYYPAGKYPLQLRLYDDIYISNYTELTRTIHKYDCPAFIQLLHNGAWDMFGLQARNMVSSSTLTENDLPGPDFVPARELTAGEIKEKVNKFASAAVRAQKAGFDGVEINASTCHLINSFLSLAWNKRHDEYGCDSMENRARFAVEIIKEIKNRSGKDYPLSVLINGAELGIEKGLKIEEARVFARILQKAGADAIQVRAFGYGKYKGLDFPEQLFYPEQNKNFPGGFDWSHKGAGALTPLAEAVKKAVSVPVITVGRLDPLIGEKILREGKADLIGFTRRLFADPELPHKVASGKLKDIAPCTACFFCGSEVALHRPGRCRINAAFGSEEEYGIKPAVKKKRVLVVGGGPAGMEAARVAALRGHEVTLYEKGHHLGGLLPMAALVKGLEIEDLPALIRYLKDQIIHLGVRIRLGKEFTPWTVDEIKPDVVILAVGGIISTPNIPGINRRNTVVLTDMDKLIYAGIKILGVGAVRWLTRFYLPIGKRVIIIGGQMHGCELAEFFIKRGRQVTIVDTFETPGEGLVEIKKSNFFEWLAEKGAKMITGVKYNEIKDKELTITSREGRRQVLKADTIVPSIKLEPNIGLLDSIKGKVHEVYAIGDCREPGLIINAVADGYRVAKDI